MNSMNRTTPQGTGGAAGKPKGSLRNEDPTIELIERARLSYGRTLSACGGASLPAELANTLALVPTLCLQLERLHELHSSQRSGVDGCSADGSSVDGLGANPEMASLERQRDQVLRMVGHELRNRLNSPRLHARLLAERLPAGGEQEARLSKLLLSGIESAASVVDDVAFLLSAPAESHVPLRSLIVDLAAQHAERAVQQGISLEVVEPLSTAPVPRSGLKLVLENLIVNAIEHHDGGDGAWVRISTFRNGDEVAVRVQDNGPGMPEEVERRLNGGPGQQNRHGLGLVVVARAVESLDGRLDVLRSEHGTGTSVVLHLRSRRRSPRRRPSRRPVNDADLGGSRAARASHSQPFAS
ncbi:MAG TPA: HAMP domain-containing sensor histidine kinase [Thermoanaerobaculia bacterium]|nr:HAMP domain-containing sensor histidine kinase [Thermoanaerobaculia bacterium]